MTQRQDWTESRGIMLLEATEEEGEAAEEECEDGGRRATWTASAHRVAWGLGALLFVSALAGLASMRPRSPGKFLIGDPAMSPMVEKLEFSRTADFTEEGDDPCDGLPFLRLSKVTHSNLGNQGPDGGEEGMIYEGEELPSGTPIFLHIHAKTPYKPQKAALNGFSGRYATINLKGGADVDLEFRVFDKDGGALTLPETEFTFFDLDSGSGAQTTEHVKVKTYDKAIYQANTELTEKRMGPGYSEFSASTVGTGSDNPIDPSQLTMQQKNRAVTFEFHDFHMMEATLGSTEGPLPRWFFFVARPSLLCAKLKGSASAADTVVVEHGQDSTEGHPATTFMATPSTTTTTKPTTTEPTTKTTTTEPTTTTTTTTEEDTEEEPPQCCFVGSLICGINWPWCG